MYLKEVPLVFIHVPSPFFSSDLQLRRKEGEGDREEEGRREKDESR